MTAVAHNPALMPPAGLSSGEAHIAHDRGHPTREAQDYSELPIERPKSIILPTVQLSMNYTNEDIPFSHPSATPLTSCYGLPRAFKAGSRCVNPLEPRYALPGASAYAAKAVAGAGESGSGPGLDSTGAAGAAGAASLPSPSRTASGTDRLLPAMSLARSTGGATDAAGAAAGASSPKAALNSNLASPLPPASPSGQGAAAAAAAAAGALSPNPHVTTNGAVGGLLLYGPGAATSGASASAGAGAGGAAAASNSPSAAAIAAAAEANRCLNVTDVNGPRRSTSTPPRRAGAAGGGYDPLQVADISGRRRPSPTRHLGSLTTSDIRGATVRPRTRDTPSPGRGTLTAADIAGASPGCMTRASPSTYALGRWPAPAVPQFHFPVATRVTMLKMPPNAMT